MHCFHEKHIGTVIKDGGKNESTNLGYVSMVVLMKKKSINSIQFNSIYFIKHYNWKYVHKWIKYK